jgi:hypothetical protein
MSKDPSTEKSVTTKQDSGAEKKKPNPETKAGKKPEFTNEISKLEFPDIPFGPSKGGG